MADTFTTNYEFTLPEIGSSINTWGNKLNTNFTEIDTQIKAAFDHADTKLSKTANLGDLEDAQEARENMGANNATNITAGTLDSERLVSRLRAVSQLISGDLDTATSAGFYRTSVETANSPETTSGYVVVIASSIDRLKQIWFPQSGSGNSYVRFRDAGVYTAWRRHGWDQSTLDDRYFIAKAGTDALAIAGVDTDQRTWSAKNLNAAIMPQLRLKAAVNFNGYDPVAIRSSHNVAGIVKNFNGGYTINWANPFANSNYILTGTASSTDGNDSSMMVIDSMAPGSATVLLRNDDGGIGDAFIVCLLAFAVE